MFKEFCEDVFRRRLDVDQDEMPHTLANVFGGREDPADRARQYVKSNPNKRHNVERIARQRANSMPRENSKY